MGVFWAAQSIVGWPHRMEATPVSLAQDPRQHIHFEVQLRWELSADQVRRACAFPPRDQPAAIVVTTVLRCKSRWVAGKCWADAATRWWLVDVQALLGATGITPAELPATSLIVDTDHSVPHFRGVGAGAAGQLRQDLVEVSLEELTLTVEPFLTAVHIYWKEDSNTTINCVLQSFMEALWSQVWILCLASINIYVPILSKPILQHISGMLPLSCQ